VLIATLPVSLTNRKSVDRYTSTLSLDGHEVSGGVHRAGAVGFAALGALDGAGHQKFGFL
jgi:hypothetical protein